MADEDDMIKDDDTAPAEENNKPAETNQEPEGALIDNDEQEKVDDSATSAVEEDKSTEGDKGSDDGAGDQGDSHDEDKGMGKPDEPTVPAQRAEEPVADPGSEFTPKGDYAFDIELADGTKVHVTKPEDIENLPADADFGTPANLMKAQAKLNVMTSGLESEKREWEANKEKFETQQTTAKDTETRVQTMIAEMDYLETKGKVPKVDPKYENADWSNPEVAKQPGVKERLELLDYRDKENETRTKLGLSPMSLIEAQLQMQQDQIDTKATEFKTKQAAQRKAKGAMVGGSGTTPVSNIPDDLIVGEGGNIRDLNPAY